MVSASGVDMSVSASGVSIQPARAANNRNHSGAIAAQSGVAASGSTKAAATANSAEAERVVQEVMKELDTIVAEQR